jgi:hypothetical protein
MYVIFGYLPKALNLRKKNIKTENSVKIFSTEFLFEILTTS